MVSAQEKVEGSIQISGTIPWRWARMKVMQNEGCVGGLRERVGWRMQAASSTQLQNCQLSLLPHIPPPLWQLSYDHEETCSLCGALRGTYFCLLVAFLHWSETRYDINSAQPTLPDHLLQESERQTCTHRETCTERNTGKPWTYCGSGSRPLQ